MKTIQTTTAAVLLLAAGSMIPAFAQDRGRGSDHNREGRTSEQQGARGGERRGGGQEFRQRDAQPQYREQRQQDASRRQETFRQQRQQPAYERQQFRPQPQQQYRQEYRPQYQPQNNYRGGVSYGFRSVGGVRWTDRGGYRGRFIPQTRFYSSFGRDHWFRIGRPAYYNGFTRFSYGGYGFQILDPVPTYWGPDWYDSDDVYVDYDGDGYYMYNRNYPDTGIAVSIDF